MLQDIVRIAICAVILGADTWPDIYEYGLAKQVRLQTILQLPDGIPSADTFRRVFMLIDKDEFENCFIRWVTSIKKADYILALKGCQADLYEDVQLFFNDAVENDFKDISSDFYETIDGGHGRVEIRRYYTIADIDQLAGKENWKDISIIGMAISERHIGDKIETDYRFYISSMENDAKKFGDAVRNHQGIENSVHQVLDAGFREDGSRKRKGDSAFNFTILRHTAMNLLRKEKTMRRGMRTKRMKAGWSDTYLAKVLATV